MVYLDNTADPGIGLSWTAPAFGDSGWTTMVVAAAQITASPAEYRPAGATDSTLVADFIDGYAAGIPLDASEEAQLMADAWQ